MRDRVQVSELTNTKGGEGGKSDELHDGRLEDGLKGSRKGFDA